MGFAFFTQQSMSFLLPFVYRYICWQMFFKIGVLKISQISQKTSVLEPNFSKVAGLIFCNFIKKRLRHRCFPVKFAKFLRTTFFTEHLQWLLLRLLCRPMPCKLNWYVESPAQVFSCEFCEIFKNIIEHPWWLFHSVARCKTSKYTMAATSNGLIVWW